MTIALYARRKGWLLNEVTVRLRHGRVHAEDCADCETKAGMLDLIEREISLSGQLAEQQWIAGRDLVTGRGERAVWIVAQGAAQ